MKIIIEAFPNRKVRDFHLNKQLANCRYGTLSKGSRRDGYDVRLRDEMDESTWNLGQDLLSIEGVDEVRLSPYRVSVVIAEAFDWFEDLIQERVVEILARHADDSPDVSYKQTPLQKAMAESEQP